MKYEIESIFNLILLVCCPLQCQQRSSRKRWAHRPPETGPY